MLSSFELLKRTTPFLFARIGIYLCFMIGSFIYVLIVSGIGWQVFKFMGDGAFVPIIILMLVALFGGYGIIRWLERYFVFLVKAGHIYVMTELLIEGDIPEGKSQLSYGKDKVVETFGKTNVFFVVDTLVDGAVRQIQRWIMKTADFFSFIPQAQTLMGIISQVLGTSLQYVDEAVLCYTMKEENNGKSVWRNSGDGIVYYAQSWKGILKTAVIIVIFKGLVWWGSFFGGMFLMASTVKFVGTLAILNILPLVFSLLLP